MLLCIGPSNQEVQDLPGVINSWIAVTHGEKPEDRVGKLVSLFLILTKFDLEFEDKRARPLWRPVGITGCMPHCWIFLASNMIGQRNGRPGRVLIIFSFAKSQLSF